MECDVDAFVGVDALLGITQSQHDEEYKNGGQQRLHIRVSKEKVWYLISNANTDRKITVNNNQGA